MKRIVAAIGFLAAACTLAAAADWPAWRGPTGQGHSSEKNLPLKWSAKDNVKWKVPLANPGYSTPVVWGDNIFLTQANPAGTVRSLFCFARADGTLRWQKDVAYADKEKTWQDNYPYANASPTTDGERVLVSFASAGMYCFDFTGKELSKRTDLGKFEHVYGSGASPVLYNDLAILWCGPNDPKGRNFLLAVDKKSGKTVWEHEESYGSWSTPLIATVKGQDQLILGQSRNVKNAPVEKTGYLKGFDPKTGTELWRCQGLNSFVYTSALVGNDVAVGMSGFGGSSLAVKLGGMGDISNDRLWWHKAPADQRVGSGVIVGDHVYMVDNNGLAHCYDLKSGEDQWKGERLKGGTWGSMVHADGRLYLLMKNADTVVMAAKPKFEILATNTLGGGEQSNSSIAVSNGDIFIRTYKNLWCIGAKP